MEGKESESESQQGHQAKGRWKERKQEEQNEPEMGTSSTPLELKNGKAKANLTNRHGLKPAQ